MSLPLGSLDGRLELRELLGAGGMGEVHAAWDQGLQRAVAVKFVRGSGAKEAERLLLEARLQARVEHPNVVQVFEVGTLSGRPCIVFQLVPGKSLQEVAPGLPVGDRVELVRQAAAGLHAAHLQGLVHRDVKPGNLLVEEVAKGDGRGMVRTALVTDFGLAHAEEGGLTRSGLLPGTLDFMAPEQLAGGGPVDFRSDVYALGATLYAVLAGRPPFRIPSARPEASGEEQVRLLRRILDEEPPALRSLATDLPRELGVIVAKAMEKEPGARYASAEAFAEDLARFQRGEPIRARPPTVADRLLKWSRRNRASSRSIAAAVVSLLAAGGFLLWSSRRAGVEALEAARLGALAASLENRMRMEYLAPPHDLRPALAAVRVEVDALRSLATRRAGGPASYALGKGLELLGDLDGARAAYERAWTLGVRTPPAAEGLGLTLARVFERERLRAAESLAPAARDRAVAALRASLLEPARRLLAGADRRGWRGAWIDASLAQAEGATELARQRAREALAAEAGLYEARQQEGAAFVQDAVELLNRSKLEEADAAIARALPILEGALDAGRSDTRVLHSIAEAHMWRAQIAYRHGKDPGPDAERALGWAERVRALDPDDAWIFQLRGQVRSTQGTHAGTVGSGGLGLLQQAVAEFQHARELRPDDATTLRLLVRALYEVAFLKQQKGAPAAAEVEEGVKVYRTALALAPADADIRTDGMLILLVRARDRRAVGAGSVEDLVEVVQAGEELLRLQPLKLGVVRQALISAVVDLATERWSHGQDPRPDLRRAIDLSEELLRDDGTRLTALTRGLWAMGTAGLLFLAMGEDFASLSSRAMEVAERARALKPDHPYVRLLKGEMSLVEARRRLAADQDPTAPLDEAERWITPVAKELGDRGTVAEDLALLPMVRARWRGAHAQDPSELLGRAEGLFQARLAKQPRSASCLGGLAICAVERAVLARRQGRPGAEEARAGLAQVARALEAESGDPELWAIQARLQGLAGDRTAARASLDKAYALQPLVRGNREAKAAETVLAGSGAVRP